MEAKAREILEALDLSRARLFDEVPCWISVQNREFDVIEANRKLIEDFGDHRTEKCYAVYKGRSAPCPECPVVRTFEDGREHTSQEIIFDRRGLPHNVFVNTRALRNRAGQIAAAMKLFTDISEEKELENRLHDSLVRLHNLFDNAPCFISVQDRQFRIVESNRRFAESFGHGLGEHCYQVYKKRSDRCPRCPVAGRRRPVVMSGPEAPRAPEAWPWRVEKSDRKHMTTPTCGSPRRAEGGQRRRRRRIDAESAGRRDRASSPPPRDRARSGSRCGFTPASASTASRGWSSAKASTRCASPRPAPTWASAGAAVPSPS